LPDRTFTESLAGKHVGRERLIWGKEEYPFGIFREPFPFSGVYNHENSSPEECMDDLDIIAQIKNGNPDAYALLVEKYHRPLLTFIFRVMGHGEQVEDIGQEVFLAVYKSLKDFDETRGTPFAAWLFTAARNRCLSALRERRARPRVGLEEIPPLPAETGTAEEMLLVKERLEALTASIRLIPEPFRQAIMLSLQGHSLEKIAALEGISAGTAKSRLFRARERLKKLVREYFGGKSYEGV
jgi:RNA polymerase sigma-70 factor (ECF subfamily)